MKKIFKYILIFTFLITATLLTLTIYIYIRYSNWEKDFNKEINPQYMVTEIGDAKELTKSIEQYTLSSEQTEYLQLEPKQVGEILFQILNEYFKEETKLQTIYIQPSKGIWKVCLQIKYINIPIWLCMDLNKDNMQTAQIYATHLNIGPFSLDKYVENINKGIANGLLTVNENGFSSRYFENIEFLEESLVIKGSKY